MLVISHPYILIIVEVIDKGYFIHKSNLSIGFQQGEGKLIRGNLGSKMGLIRKRAKISFCELEFKNQ